MSHMKPSTTSEWTHIHGFHSSYSFNNKIFIKTSKQDDLTNEAKELERCKNESIKTAHVIPSEFLSWDASKNSLTSTYIVEAKSYFNILWNNASFLGKMLKKADAMNMKLLLQRSREIGEWLRLYHDSTINRNFDIAQMADRMLKSFSDKSNRIRDRKLIPGKLLDKYQAVFCPVFEQIKQKGVAYLNEQDAHCCVTHGDFIAYNISIDKNENARVVDFGSTNPGVNLEDVGRFYELFYAIGSMSGNLCRVFNNLKNQFVAGYRLSETALQSDLFFAIRAYNGLVHSIASDVQKDYDSFFTRIMMRRITNKTLAWMNKRS